MSSRGAAFRASFNASAYQRGEKLGLTEEEAAFYDALGTNDSAVQALGDENLRFIAQELTRAIRENVTIDWTEREAVRARLRVMVKRILRKYGLPAGQTGSRNENSSRAGRGPLRRMGRVGRLKSVSLREKRRFVSAFCIIHDLKCACF